MLVAEPPYRHRTYHEVLWKCFPKERLLQTLQHGLHFHADLTQWSLGWKFRDLGNLALGQNLPSTLETARAVPGAWCSSAWPHNPCSQLLTTFSSPCKKRKREFLNLFQKNCIRLIGILSKGPPSGSPAHLSRRGLCQLLPVILMGPFFRASELLLSGPDKLAFYSKLHARSAR